ncbi:MAG: hypothetical protein J6T06_05040, partial [Victivallales bacterium]|nr:hypothetical protein [Victivallales bacterium]
MLLLKKVTSNSDIESLQIPFAEQNIYLLAQDAAGRQIFGRQTCRNTKQWPNSFFVTPLEFNATLYPNVQCNGQPQTATVELTLKFNMLCNAVGMYDWMHQNNLTSLEDNDLPKKLQSFEQSLGTAVEHHVAQTNNCYLTSDELVNVFPTWLQVVRIASTQIGPRLAKPITMATPTDKKHTPPPPPISEKTKAPTAKPRPAHQPPCNKTANPPNLFQKDQPQKPPKRKTPRGCCCSHFFLLMLLIFCIIGGGLIHLVKAVKNAVVTVVTPIVEWIKRPASSPAPVIIKTDGGKTSFMLPSNIPLELLKVKAGSYQPTSPYGSVQPPSYQITIPKDYWLTEQEITEAQWRTMMSTSLNTMG